MSNSNSVPNQEGMLERLKSLEKEFSQLGVWPPTVELSFSELTKVSNCIILWLALQTSRTAGLCAVMDGRRLEHHVSKVLYRVLKNVHPTSRASSLCVQGQSVKEIMAQVTETLKDPIVHFKLLEVTGRLLLVFCLWCLYCQSQECEKRSSIRRLKKLWKLASEPILKEKLVLENGLVSCDLPTGSEGAEEHPCVGELVSLVLASCSLGAEQLSISWGPWRALGTYLKCKELMKQTKHQSAMTLLSLTLSSQIDPEPKSRLLCLFADCYLQQHCPQLAIQTYRKALSTDQGNFAVFHHLSCIYCSLGQHDLELETLNLLVRLLTDQHMRKEAPQLTYDLDELIWRVCGVTTEVTLQETLLHFARRCFQLYRFEDASEQFITLLHLLQDTDTHFESAPTYRSPRHIDVRELIAEAAESLVLARQFSECISLCDEFYPVLAADDTFASSVIKTSQQLLGSQETDAHIADNIEEESMQISQNLFSPVESEHSGNKSDFVPGSVDKFIPLGSQRSDKGFGQRSSLAAGSVDRVASLMRKRPRTESVAECEKESEETVRMRRWMAAKLLSFKADALIAVQEQVDDVMACLQRAHTLLMESAPPPDSVTSSLNEDKPSQSPLRKRRRLFTDPDSSIAGSSSEVQTQAAAQIEEEIVSENLGLKWKTLVVEVTLRMARMSVRHGRLPSAVNLCQVVLQLDSDNSDAHYLRTVALREGRGGQDVVSVHWLKLRHFPVDSGSDSLKAALTNLPVGKKLPDEKKDRLERQWWQASEDEMRQLDRSCLETVLNQRPSM